ncbi:MAG: four helix bundle protein [Bacteroidetes bacterium]|nr:four helix bundle protein [Bacteroidota bacterium]
MRSVLKNKSYNFAIRIVKLYQYLYKEKKEIVLSKQILRCGMSIGALVREAEFGQSRADFTSKMSIALKKANETDYWLSLLNDTNYLNEKEYNSLDRDNTEVIKILISTIKTSKKNLKKIIIYYSLFTIH